jgi:hypothetical protein
MVFSQYEVHIIFNKTSLPNPWRDVSIKGAHERCGGSCGHYQFLMWCRANFYRAFFPQMQQKPRWLQWQSRYVQRWVSQKFIWRRC